jgi:hypothetical protein
MYVVSGQTFPYRNLFKRLDGMFDGTTKTWMFDYLSPQIVAELRMCIGIVVTSTKPERPRIYSMREPEPTWERPTETVVVGDDQTYKDVFADANPILFVGFSSLAEFCDYVENLQRPDNTGGTCDIGWCTSPKRQKVTDTVNMAEALYLARSGWTDGLGLAEKFDIPFAERKRRMRSVAGGSVSVGRMLSGDPKHMNRRVHQPKHKRVTLMVETVMWEGILAENAMLRALLIASVIDLLEQQGYMCEIYAVSASKSIYDRQAQTHLCVQLKQAGERLNILDIAFALGHPAFLRRMKFACEGVVPAINMLHEHRGLISEAFNQHHRPPKDCYYFRQLAGDRQAAYALDGMEMLSDILPHNLPIDIKPIQ